MFHLRAAFLALSFTLAFGLHGVEDAVHVADDGKVGVGTDAPVESLHVNGNLRVDGAILGTVLPGTSLVSPHLSADMTSLAADVDHDVAFDTEEWDDLSEFDPATGIYTSASDQRAEVNVRLYGDTMTSGKKTFICKIWVDTGAGFAAVCLDETVASGGQDSLALSRIVALSAGDRVKITVRSDSGGFSVRGTAVRNHFQITRR